MNDIGAPTQEIHYVLPVSPRDPRLREQNTKDQVASLDGLLAVATDAKPLSEHINGSAILIVHHVSLAEVPAGLAETIAHVEEELSAPGVAREIVTVGSRRDYCLKPSHWLTAVGLLTACEPWADRWADRWPPPVELAVLSMFRWRIPGTADLLPRQGSATAPWRGGEMPSNLTMQLGPGGWVSGDLHFPFSQVDAPFLEFLVAIRPLLPFPVLPRHFRLAPIRPDGSYGRLRRLSTPQLGVIGEALV